MVGSLDVEHRNRRNLPVCPRQANPPRPEDPLSSHCLLPSRPTHGVVSCLCLLPGVLSRKISTASFEHRTFDLSPPFLHWDASHEISEVVVDAGHGSSHSGQPKKQVVHPSSC